MSSSKTIKPIAAAVGAAFAGTMLASGAANANPFGLAELNGGYMQVAQAAEGKCGGSKAAAPMPAEGKCGEGKCGGDKAAAPKAGEGKCGGDKAAAPKAAEGKCGEGKCGGSK